VAGTRTAFDGAAASAEPDACAEQKNGQDHRGNQQDVRHRGLHLTPKVL